MKEADRVRLVVEKEKYVREGVHKGANGTICDPRNINGQWLVSFREQDGFMELACIPVKEEDLEVTWEAPVCKVGANVLFFSTKEKYSVQGITNGMFGVIVAQGKDEEHWKVKFILKDGTEKFVSVYDNDMQPIRDDELDAYKKEAERELKRRQMR